MKGKKKPHSSKWLLKSGTWKRIWILLKIYLFASAQTCLAITCPSTHSGLTLYGPSHEYKCYGYPGTQRTYGNSHWYCDGIGMRLPIINSASENVDVKGYLGGRSGVWIGLYDYYKEGTMVWRWGETAPLYTNWNSGEPNNAGNEDCVEMLSDGKWNDKTCSSLKYTLCSACAVGAYFDGRNCALCPSGKFKEVINYATSCDDCPAGTFVSNIGQSACLNCPVGSSSQPGAVTCTTCLPGHYNNVPGGTCKPCEAGKYSNSDRTNCLACPDGTYATGGASACTPCGSPLSHWIGGATLQSNCRCKPPWSGSKCDLYPCPDNLDTLSLGSLLLQSIRTLKNFTTSFSPEAVDTHATVRGILEELFCVTVDADGDEIITHDEITATLRSLGVYGSNFINLKVWCSSGGECGNDYDRNQLIEEAYTNYLTSTHHEFDGTGLDLLSSFQANFPLTSWSDQECAATSNQPVSVNWDFSPNAPSFYRVCGYSNGVLLSAFNTDNTGAIDGTVTTFDDSIPISSNFGFRRVYCLRIEYCATRPRSETCTPDGFPSLFTSRVICTVGLRYDGTPIDLSASLSETGVSFRYMDTSVGETRFDIFYDRDGESIPATHIASIPYPSDGCGRISNHIAFADRLNADLVGTKLVYGVRAVRDAGVSSLTAVNYRIPFIGTISGSVKTSSGAPVRKVVVSICHIDPLTGADDVVSAFCPLTIAKTDDRGIFVVPIRVSHPKWNQKVEQFRLTPQLIEHDVDGNISHVFTPVDQVVTLDHRSRIAADFTDETSISIRGTVRFDPALVDEVFCPFEGVVVFLTSSDGIVSNTTTDSEGVFLFSLSRKQGGVISIPNWRGHKMVALVTLSTRVVIPAAPASEEAIEHLIVEDPHVAGPTSSPTKKPSVAVPPRKPTIRPTIRPTASPTVRYKPKDIVLLHEFTFDNDDGQDTKSDSFAEVVGSGVSFKNGAAVFIGGNGYVRLPRGCFRESQNITIEAWVDIDSSNPANSILFSFGPLRKSISFRTGTSGVSRHIAVVLRNEGSTTVGKVYVGGVLVSSSSWEESSLLGGTGLTDESEFLGKNAAGTSPPFVGSIHYFRVWWGELSPSTIYAHSALGGENVKVELASPMTVGDVNIEYLVTTVQEVQVGFYGVADYEVEMFDDAVEFIFQSTTCSYNFNRRLGSLGEPFIGLVPAMNYTVTMQEFQYTFPTYENEGMLFDFSYSCAPSSDPFEYVSSTGQTIQDLVIVEVREDPPYLVKYFYRSGLCLHVVGASGLFNPHQVPSISTTDETCYDGKYKILREEVPETVAIYVFERYPVRYAKADYNTQLSDVTLYITDDVSGLEQRLALSYAPSTSRVLNFPSFLGHAYTINPKNPFPIAPFHWLFQVQAKKSITSSWTSEHTLTWYVPVTGVLTNPFSTYLPVASDPNLIFMVLRDPPGGGSFTTIETGTTIDFALSLDGMYTLDHDQNWNFKLGIGKWNEQTLTFLPGVPAVTVVDAQDTPLGVGASVTSQLTTTRVSSTHYQYSFEFASSFSTSRSPNDAGHASDLIIGGGVDLVVLEGTAVKYRSHEESNLNCFYSEAVKVWTPGELTTFVLSVREIEMTIVKLKTLRDQEKDETTSAQLGKQVRNWEKVLADYQVHNTDELSLFHADEEMMNNEINDIVKTLQLKSKSMQYDSFERFPGDSFAWRNVFNEFHYSLGSRCGYLENYQVASSFCDQFRSENWKTVGDAISNGACNMIIPNALEGEYVPNSGTSKSRQSDPDPTPYPTRAPSVTPLKDLTLFSKLCNFSNGNLFKDLPGEEPRGGSEDQDPMNSIFGFLKDNSKILTFGAGAEISFSYTSAVTNAMQMSSDFNYKFESAGGPYASMKIAIGPVFLDGGGSTVLGNHRTRGDNVEVKNDRATRRTVTITLSDPDPGDYFAVRVSSDSTFGTPVFTTLGGQSSCPAETSTLGRETGLLMTIEPRCGENGMLGDCSELPPGSLAFFTARITNFSPTGDAVSFTLGINSYFDESPATYQLCGVDGQRAGLEASFSSTDLWNIPYAKSIDVVFSIKNTGACQSYKQVAVGIYSMCETIYKYQYEALRKPDGSISIAYGNVSSRISTARRFDVSWSSSSEQRSSSSSSTGGSTTIEDNTALYSLLFIGFILLLFVILSSIWSNYQTYLALGKLSSLPDDSGFHFWIAGSIPPEQDEEDCPDEPPSFQLEIDGPTSGETQI